MEKSVNISVKEVSLDSLVEAAVSASSSSGVGTDYSRIQSQQAELKDKIADKQNQIQQVQDYDDKKRSLESELHALLAQKVGLVKEASRARDAVKDASRHLDGARRAARDSILQDADIICATLSGSGHESLAPYIFETVIIDEAAQAIEMSCLIPLKYGCTRCIMVGGEAFTWAKTHVHSDMQIRINCLRLKSARSWRNSSSMNRCSSEWRSGTRRTCTSLGKDILIVRLLTILAFNTVCTLSSRNYRPRCSTTDISKTARIWRARLLRHGTNAMYTGHTDS
jgi:hypothetical protein